MLFDNTLYREAVMSLQRTNTCTSSSDVMMVVEGGWPLTLIDSNSIRRERMAAVSSGEEGGSRSNLFGMCWVRKWHGLTPSEWITSVTFGPQTGFSTQGLVASNTPAPATKQQPQEKFKVIEYDGDKHLETMDALECCLLVLDGLNLIWNQSPNFAHSALMPYLFQKHLPLKSLQRSFNMTQNLTTRPSINIFVFLSPPSPNLLHIEAWV